MESDLAYQARILQGVSRTFALTIPELPGPLATVVSNAYLLCRIADTIEDEPGLDPQAKRELSEAFIAALAGEVDPAAGQAFADELHPRLTASSLPAEHDLVRNTARVLAVTRTFNPVQVRALERCVRVMSRGMSEFQRDNTVAGLDDMRQMDRYCYHVAGVVGEMLTELFCDHNPAIAARQGELAKRSVSFGQGLQMTNILKDMWEDRARGACWLPRDVFARAGVDLRTLDAGDPPPGFVEALLELIGIARGHLANALAYTLAIPASETGIRRFCLWALGMAVLTLRRLHGNPRFTAGDQVKISRTSVRATVVATSAAVRHDAILRALFGVFTRALPGPDHTSGAVSA